MTDDELAAEVESAFRKGPRLSPTAARFMAGDMDVDEAMLRGYLPRRPDGPPPDDILG